MHTDTERVRSDPLTRIADIVRSGEEPRLSTIDSSKPFVDEGHAAVHGLRRAFAELLASVGANAEEPQELSRRFGLDKMLTWRIARVVREEDVWEAVQHIPRRPSIHIFVGAMTKHGAPQDRVDSLWTALQQFEQFVETHSGDRETLEMMSSVAARRSADKRLEAFRKSGYDANSAIWGVRARTQIALRVVSPNRANPELLDLGTIGGLVDFRRLRASSSWAITTIASWEGAEEQPVDASDSTFEWIEPGSKDAVLREFSSPPNVQVRVVDASPTRRRYMLTEGPVGNTASASVFCGWINRAVVSRHASFPKEEGEHGTQLFTPAESLIHDVAIHRDCAFAFKLRATVYSQMPGGPTYPNSGSDAVVLPLSTEIIELGDGLSSIATSDIPRYVEMTERIIDRMGHSPRDFKVFRYRLRYPPIPAISVIRHELLPPKA